MPTWLWKESAPSFWKLTPRLPGMARSPGKFLRDFRAKQFGGTNLTTTQNFPVMPYGWETVSGFTDIREIGDGSRNSAVVGALNVLKTRFPEPPGKVFEKAVGPEEFGEEVEDHPLEALLNKPNPHMLGEELAQYVVSSAHIAGDAYWIKNRSPAGVVKELWPVLPSLMEPLATKGWSGPVLVGGTTRVMTVEDDSYIGLYRYTINGVETYFLPDDVVHFRPLGFDDADHRHGFSPIRSVLRELVGDEAASQFQTALLKRMGFPGLIFSPKVLPDGVEYPSTGAAKQMKSDIVKDYGGHNRGSTMVMTGPFDVTIAAFSPEQLDLRTSHFHAEHRVAAALGVPAVLAGFGAGIESSSGKSETVELIRDFTTGKLVPLWRIIGARITESLLIPDFEGDRSRIFRFDTRSVKALQANRGEQIEAAVGAYIGGIATRGEARLEVGFDAAEADNVFLVPATAMTIPRDDDSTPPPSPNGEITEEDLAELLA